MAAHRRQQQRVTLARQVRHAPAWGQRLVRGLRLAAMTAIAGRAVIAARALALAARVERLAALNPQVVQAMLWAGAALRAGAHRQSTRQLTYWSTTWKAQKLKMAQLFCSSATISQDLVIGATGTAPQARSTPWHRIHLATRRSQLRIRRSRA